MSPDSRQTLLDAPGLQFRATRADLHLGARSRHVEESFIAMLCKRPRFLRWTREVLEINMPSDAQNKRDARAARLR